MKVMILAAGRGQRMLELTDYCPKPLLKAGGKTLIEWQLLALAKAGFTEIIINVSYLGEMIQNALGNGSRYGVAIQYSLEQQALESAGGIRQALPLLGNKAFLVTNADIFTDYDYRQLQTIASNMPAVQQAHLVLVNNPAHNPAGDFNFSPSSRLSRQASFPNQSLTFAGIAVYRPEYFSALTLGEAVKLSSLLRHSLDTDALVAEHHHGYWLDVGTPERLAELNERLNRITGASTQ